MAAARTLASFLYRAKVARMTVDSVVPLSGGWDSVLALCEATAKESPASGAWLGKVRPYWGHHYHMHIRMQCPPDSPNCRPQKPTGGEIGCDKELAYWFRILSRPKPPKPILPRKPVKPRPPMTIASLPQECRAVMEGPAKLTPLQVPTAAGKP